LETIIPRLTSLCGLVFFLAIAWGLSENRRVIPWRVLLWGLGLEFIFGLLVLRTRLGLLLFDSVRRAFDVLTASATEGARFVFGTLPTNFDLGAVVAFQVLPVIIFVSALAAILQHFRVIQAAIWAMTAVMRATLKTSGAETFAAALQVFLGIEAQTALKGYLNDMTRSELFTVMTTFMASIAASVMVAYASFGAEPGHLLAASVMSAPAAILISKLMIPETGHPRTAATTRIAIPVETHNAVDAAARGAAEGLNLALHVGAMLITFIGLVYMLNLGLTALTGWTFQQVMGWLFWPFAFAMGVPLEDVGTVAQLLGKKTVLNEFLAYADFKPLMESGALHPRAAAIATYALCGFANPGSLGILIGGTAALIPGRRAEVVELAVKSFIAGTLATFLTACIAGMLVHA